MASLGRAAVVAFRETPVQESYGAGDAVCLFASVGLSLVFDHHDIGAAGAMLLRRLLRRHWLPCRPARHLLADRSIAGTHIRSVVGN
ncbi:hypothetical protein GCM10018966_101210 [Streptomyces yanii]